ncbi:hypothetical protein CTI12_AA028040 [Artemisia annua]|uniref:Uncharacterized protein n=1 Tax=Artemisia annua TaxID=35608 RepID=A0A2U1Q0A9_ARTAN|nr:hypothetical protein CTI12_AA028040 [Artemisia annua]
MDLIPESLSHSDVHVAELSLANKEEKDVSTSVSKVMHPEGKDSDLDEDDLWNPHAIDRWDFNDGKDSWASDFESDEYPEKDDANE